MVWWLLSKPFGMQEGAPVRTGASLERYGVAFGDRVVLVDKKRGSPDAWIRRIHVVDRIERGSRTMAIA